MTDLSPDLFKQFQDALCHAFPKKADLMQMARFGLGENLDEIAGGETLRDITFSLIQHAESHGKLQQLIDGALAENPDNPKLIAFNATWTAAASTIASASSASAIPQPESTNARSASAATAQPDPTQVTPSPARRGGRGVRSAFQPTTFPYDVFLSHSSADKPTVRQIAQLLTDAGLTVWFDEWIIQPGDSIPRKIEHGLQNSRVLLLCMTDEFFESDWARLEGSSFLFRDPSNEARRFVPLLLSDCTIPDMLAQFLYIFLYIDWRTPDDVVERKLFDACQPPTKENTEPLEPDQPEPEEQEPQPTRQEIIDTELYSWDAQLRDKYCGWTTHRIYPILNLAPSR